MLALCHHRGVTQKAVLEWMRAVIVANAKRVMTQPNMTVLSKFVLPLSLCVCVCAFASHKVLLCRSDAFFFNLSSVMLSLCSKFSDPASPTAKKIDPTFLLCGSDLFPNDDPRLVAPPSDDDAAVEVDADDSDEDLYGPAIRTGAGARAGAGAGAGAGADMPVKREDEYGFVSRLFFLCVRCLHVGLLPVREMSLTHTPVLAPDELFACGGTDDCPREDDAAPAWLPATPRRSNGPCASGSSCMSSHGCDVLCLTVPTPVLDICSPSATILVLGVSKAGQ